MYLSFFGILIGKITYGDSKMFNKMCINYQKLKKKSGLKVNVLIASTIKGKKGYNLLLEPYSFSELLGCSATIGHCLGISLDHTARIARTKTH